jgi:hypothetical protein
MLDISKPDTKVVIKGRIAQLKKIAPVIDSYGYVAPGSLRSVSTMLQRLEEQVSELEYIRLKPGFMFTYLYLGDISDVPDNGDYTYYTVEEFIQATQKLLTPEEIFVTFLKHHRKFASFKRRFATRSRIFPLTVPMVQGIFKAFVWDFGYWQKLNVQWNNLCKQFDIENTTLDYTKIKGLKYER